jgi:hypothetical protein
MDQPDDSSRFYATMATIVQQQSTLIEQNVVLASQNANLISTTADLANRIAALEASAASANSQGGSEFDRWECPVCHSPLKHRESYKGHIRRLAQAPVDSSNRCFLDSQNPLHVALLSNARYGTGDFDSRAEIFSGLLYDRVRSATSSRTTSESSHRAVCIQAPKLIDKLTN